MTSSNIKVAVRIRPVLPDELQRGIRHADQVKIIGSDKVKATNK
jgi:hypothetical protein